MSTIEPSDRITNPVIRIAGQRAQTIQGTFTVDTVDVVPISDGPDIVSFSLKETDGIFLLHDQRRPAQ